MAETKAATTRMLPVFLERAKGENAIQAELVSVNGKDYLVPRGKSVEVPEEVYEAIVNAKNAENAYFDKVERLAKQASSKEALN